jgi:hypothetical protein
MILPIVPDHFRVVAVDRADPSDLSGGGHDDAYLLHSEETPDPEVFDLSRCLRARVLGGWQNAPLATAPTSLTYETTTGVAYATFEPERF